MADLHEYMSIYCTNVCISHSWFKVLNESSNHFVFSRRRWSWSQRPTSRTTGWSSTRDCWMPSPCHCACRYSIEQSRAEQEGHTEASEKKQLCWCITVNVLQEAGVEKELVNLLCRLSAQHYLPILAHHRVTTEALCHMNSSDLKKVCVHYLLITYMYYIHITIRSHFGDLWPHNARFQLSYWFYYLFKSPFLVMSSAH